MSQVRSIGEWVFCVPQGAREGLQPSSLYIKYAMLIRIICSHPSYCFVIQLLTTVQVTHPSQGFDCQQKVHELITLWYREACSMLYCSLLKIPGGQIFIRSAFQEKSNEDWEVLLDSKKKSCLLPAFQRYLFTLTCPFVTLFVLILESTRQM